jgi:hypothetical protein
MLAAKEKRLPAPFRVETGGFSHRHAANGVFCHSSAVPFCCGVTGAIQPTEFDAVAAGLSEALLQLSFGQPPENHRIIFCN